MKRSRLALACALLATGAAHAADPAAPAPAVEHEVPAEGWRFQVTPYGWISGVAGKVRPAHGLPTLRAHLSARDVLDNLDGAVFLHGTARKGRFLLHADASLAVVSQSRLLHLPVVGLPARIRGEVRQTAVSLAAGYSVIASPDLTVDLLAGARGWHIRAAVRADAFIAPAFAVSAAGASTTSWIDPIVGARIRWQLAPDWSIIAHADLGGFGVGSRLTWQAMATVNYRLTDNIYLSAGYRHLAFDYRRRGRILDTQMSGPILGATYRF